MHTCVKVITGFGRMPRRCAAANCKNTQTTSGISFHRFPTKNLSLLSKWEMFPQLKRAHLKVSGKSRFICSEHFVQTDFINFEQNRLGFQPKRVLSRLAVPSVQSCLKRKRELSRFPTANDENKRTLHNKPCCTCRCHEKSAPSETDGTPPVMKIFACAQTVNPQQCERWSQTDDKVHPAPLVQMKKVDFCQQTDPEEPKGNRQPLAVHEHLFEVMEEEPVSESDEEEGVVTDRENEDWELRSNQSEESGDTVITGSSEVGSSTQNELPTAPHEQRKFLIFESCLRELFERCRSCQQVCTVEFATCGSAVTVTSSSKDCSEVWIWNSQPKVRQAFAGNLLLSAAILFSGCLAAKVFRFLDTLKVVRISRSTHFYHQKRYLHATVHGVWAEEQQQVVAALREAERPLFLAGDGRSDSPGHCAKYGGYTIVECQVKRVLDVQVVQSNEVTSSNACELEGMKRALAYVENQDLRVDTIITDRHRSIAKYVRDEHPHVRHYYDTWHVAKGLGKKLDSLASKKGCELVGDWRKSITNHIHWCAATTPDGNGDLMLAKWLSLMNHLVNIHDGHGREFPSCEHEEIGERDDKEWFEPGTEIYTRLGDILENKFLLKDVRQLSPVHQTSGLEAFHSLILSFAPKNVAFSYLGMRSRLRLAGLHYNENADKDFHRDDAGAIKYSIIFPKAKKGDFSLQKRRLQATYGYAARLTEYLMREYTNSPRNLELSLLDHVDHVPDHLASQYHRPTMQEAVQHRVTRFPPAGGV